MKFLVYVQIIFTTQKIFTHKLKMKAIIEVKGGFGNQLFQFAFSNHLRNLGYDVTISLNHLKTNTPGITKREIIVKPEIFGFKEASYIRVIFYRFLYRLSQSDKLVDFLKKIINNNFEKFSKISEFKNKNKMRMTYFDGYWQEIEILENQKTFIINCLRKDKYLKNSFDKPIKKGSTLLQVRRGDYLDIGEELNSSFYNECLDYCIKNIKNFNYEIFTDDPSWVENQDYFRNAKLIHKPLDSVEEIKKTFDSMINFENYIVGNSTFSLVASILSESKNSKIIIAEPWFKNNQKKIKYKNKWIRIKNS